MSNDADENVNVLVDLGLTRAQARSYLTLLKIGTASTKEIAQASKVARPDTYRAVADLLDLGLTEKIVSVPARFKPLPIREAVDALILKRTNANLQLSQRANRLVLDLQDKLVTKPPSEDNQLVLLPCGEALAYKLRNALRKTSELVCGIIPRKQVALSLSKNLEVAEKALSRKVAVQLLTDPPIGEELAEVNDLKKNPLFQIRYFACPPGVCFIIIDNKETLLPKICSSAGSKPSILWSNHLCITELAKNYFKTHWNCANTC